MAEAITLNIGNGAVTLAYNEIVYSFTVGNDGANSDETTNYTWSLLLLMNPYCIQSYILPYIAYTFISAGASMYIDLATATGDRRVAYLNYSQHRIRISNNTILMLLN